MKHRVISLALVLPLASVLLQSIYAPALAQISQEDVSEAAQRSQEEQEQEQQQPLAQGPSIPDSLIVSCTTVLQYEEYLGGILPRCDHDLLYFKGLCENTNTTENYCFNFDMDRYLNVRGISDAARPPESFCRIYNNTESCEY